MWDWWARARTSGGRTDLFVLSVVTAGCRLYWMGSLN